MDIHNSQFGACVEYKTFDIGTPSWAVKPGPAAILPIPFIPGTPIATENFEGTLWVDVPFDSGDWEVTSSTSHGGTKCFRGKTGIAAATTQFTIFDFFGSQQLSFWYKMPDIVTGFINDLFEVKVDGATVFSQNDVVADWTYVSIPLTFAFQIDFIFHKNFPIVDDTDTVFLDDLVLGGLDTPGVPGSPAHPLIYTPFHLTVDDELIVTVSDTITVMPPHLNCATDSVEICNDAGSPISVQGTIALDGPTLAALEVTDLGPTTLAALETITVLQGTSPWVVTGTINIGSITFPFAYPEDSGHVSGNTGAFVLGVRNDNGGSLVNNDLDYAPLQLDSKGALRVTTRSDKRTGLYFAASPNSNLTTAADAATSGRFWITNTSSIVQIRIIEIRYTSLITSLIDLGSQTPIVTIERMTFTGTPSGTLIVPAKRDSTDPANTGTFRSAATGMTITAGAVLRSWYPASQVSVGGLLAVNATALPVTEQGFFPRDETGDIVLRQNEGIVFRQASAGSSTEARTMQIDIVWEEYTV